MKFAKHKLTYKHPRTILGVELWPVSANTDDLLQHFKNAPLVLEVRLVLLLQVFHLHPNT